MKIDLYFKAGILSLLLILLTFNHSNSQSILNSFKDSSSGKFGYKNQTGKVVIPAKYQSANSFASKVASV
jgi:hypothetical protein